MKKFRGNYIILAVFLLGFGTLKIVAQGNLVNILPSDYFGFEKESASWFMQHPENYAIVNEKAANGSVKSLKYSNTSVATAQLKAHSSATIPEMLISLSAGTYTIKTMVWIDPAAEISAFRITLKPIFTNAVFDVSSTIKGEWVEVSSQLVLNSDNLNGNLMIVMDTSYGGKGTMYFDDIQILSQASAPVQEAPFISKITTSKNQGLNLEAGQYNLSLKVWKDENATINKFSTVITAPWVLNTWDLEGIAKNQWIELNQDIVLDSAAINAEFRISVNNNPEFGGGNGVFYIDDMVFTKTANLDDAIVLNIETIGETCENKNNGQLIITASETHNYNALLNGVSYDFLNDKTIENLKPGDYELCITREGNINFERCFKFKIEKAVTISAKATTNSKNTIITIEEGTPPFKVIKNGLFVFETNSTVFEIESTFGDIISIKTAIECEGEFIDSQNYISMFPNPASDYFQINAPKDASIEICNTLGAVVKKIQKVEASPIINISDLSAGVYVVKIVLEKQVLKNKLIVK